MTHNKYSYFKNVDMFLEENKYSCNATLMQQLHSEIEDLEIYIKGFVDFIREHNINFLFTQEPQQTNLIKYEKEFPILGIEVLFYFEVVHTVYNTNYVRKKIIINNNVTTQTSFKGITKEINKLKKELGYEQHK